MLYFQTYFEMSKLHGILVQVYHAIHIYNYKQKCFSCETALLIILVISLSDYYHLITGLVFLVRDFTISFHKPSRDAHVLT